MAAFMIQSMGEEQRGIDRKFELFRSCVHQQGHPAVSCRQSGAGTTGAQGTLSWPWDHCCPGCWPWPACAVPPPALPIAHESLPCPAPGLLSWSLSPSALALPRVLWQERQCLPQLLPCTAPAAPQHIYQCIPFSVSSRAWVVHQSWLLQIVGTRSSGLWTVCPRMLQPKDYWASRAQVPKRYSRVL